MNVLNCYKYKSPYFYANPIIFDSLYDNLFCTKDQNPAIEPSLSSSWCNIIWYFVNLLFNIATVKGAWLSKCSLTWSLINVANLSSLLMPASSSSMFRVTLFEHGNYSV